jgi:Protein of unknown function (DUF3147)
MKVEFDFSALRQIRWHEYASRFVLGGVITVATGLIARHFGPVIGGLFLAFPAIFPASVTLVQKHEKEKKEAAGIRPTPRGRLAAALDARGTALGTIGLGAFGLVVWKLLPAHGAAPVLSGALATWLVVAIAAWRLRRRCHLPAY